MKCENNDYELINCNFVKTILMLLVVIYHCMIYWTGKWFLDEPIYKSTILSIISQWLNTFHIYGFTLVSGYLFYYMKYEKNQYQKFIPFIINKSKRLLLPYAFVSIVWVIPMAVYWFDYGIFDIVKRFILGGSPNQLWFLLMLFDVFLIFYPISDFVKSHNFLGFLLIYVLYAIGIIFIGIVPNVFQIWRACSYMLLFWLGFKIRQYGSYYLYKIPSLIWIIADLSLFVIVQSLREIDGIIIGLVCQGLTCALHIVGALMAFVILQKIATKVQWKEHKTFIFLGKNSMPIYLFHQQVIYILLYWLNGVINPYLHVIINIVVTMFVSLVISTILMRFKMTRFLIGEK